MRPLAVAAALGLLVLPAVAQTADSVAWRRYFPLAVGNVWEYAYESEEPPNPLGPGYHHQWIERYQVVARYERQVDTLFAVARRGVSEHAFNPSAADTVWVRYDEGTTAVVLADNQWRGLLHGLPFNLGAPMDGWGGHSQAPDPFPARFAAKRVTNIVGTGGVWIADVGMLHGSIGYDGCSFFCGSTTWRLVRATVGGTTYEVAQSTVAAERSRTAETMTLHPSVTRTAATLRLAAPSTVEAFDVSGRRVYRADASDGEHQIDVSAWGPGLYLVRAAGETRRLVVR